MTDLRFPVGKFDRPQGALDDARRAQFIDQIAACPAKMRAAVAGLTDQQLDTSYRPDGWTVRQVVHHVPDSHLNAYVRCKLALTEDSPAIKTYEEQLWAELPEARRGLAEMSLKLLDALHERWVEMLRSMKAKDFARTFKHPQWSDISLDQTLALYAWHSRHHVAHITELRRREGW